MPAARRRPVDAAVSCRRCSLPRAVVAAALGGMLVLALPARAATGVATAESEAVAACEQSARRTLATKATQPADLTFKVAPAVQPALPSDTQLVLSGEGRWRAGTGTRVVRFTCYVDRQTLETVGLVMRDTTPVAVKAAPARKPAEPDLGQLSMASCESSAVQALQKRWPRVTQITFDSDTRSFRQDSSDRAVLHGRGRALPTVDAPSTFFGFECEIDPHDGQVLRTRVSG
jgi:hypothetical protein